MKVQSGAGRVLASALAGLMVWAPIAPALADTFKYEYDAEGRLTKVTDGRNLSTVNTLDALGRTTLVTQPKPTTTSAVPTIGFTYDGRDQTKTVTDPRSKVTTYTVTGLGDATGLVSPDTGTTTNTYDPAGNLKTTLDARGKTITYSYDVLNRLTNEHYQTGADTWYNYDQADGLSNTTGRLNGVSGDAYQTRFAYNGFGNLLTKDATVAGQLFRNSYAWGTSGASTGKVTSITYPSGQKALYEYDAAGRVSAVRWVPWDGTAQQTVLQSIQYNPAGGISGWTWGNGSQEVRTYDLDGHITGYTLGQAGQGGLTRTLTYDAAGRITAYNHTATSTTAASAATYSITSATGTTTTTVDQRFNAGQWVDIGQFNFNAGTAYPVSVQANASGKVYADAVRYVSADVPAHSNVASASLGAVATASSTLSTGFPTIAAINGDRKGAEDSSGRGVMWADATNAAYPDWLQVHFPAARMIGEIVVVTAQDNMAAPVEPSDTTTFTNNGLTAFDIQYWNGSAWVTVPGGSITGNNKVLKRLTFTPLSTTDVRVNITGAAGGVSRVMELEAYTPSDEALAGWTTDNTATGGVATGTWATETTATGFYGTNYRSHVAGTSTDKFTWTTTIPSAGKYRVQARWPADGAAQASYNQTFGYDDLNRLTTWTTGATSQGYGYDLTGNRTSQTIGANSYTDTIASSSNRLSSTSGPAPAKTNTYDNAGNLTADGTITLAYSDRGRLGSITRTAGTVNYFYNERGERIYKTGPTALVPGGGRYFAYDEAGHILGEYSSQGLPVQEFIWVGDIPVAVLVPQSTGTIPEIFVDDTDTTNTTATGTWTTVGTSKEHVAASSSTDKFEWRLNVTTAGPYNLYATWASGWDRSNASQYTLIVGSTTTTYTVNQMVNGYAFVKLASLDLPVGLVTVRLVPNGTGKVSADGIRLVNAPKPATQYAIYTDHLNAPRVITNAAGQMVWRWDTTDPFGMTPPNQNPAGLGAFTMNLRLPGQFYDSESGLFQNYFRDYDPSLGRYVQSDPIGLRGGINTYAYSASAPTIHIDPNGLQLSPAGCANPANAAQCAAAGMLPEMPAVAPPAAGVAAAAALSGKGDADDGSSSKKDGVRDWNKTPPAQPGMYTCRYVMYFPEDQCRDGTCPEYVTGRGYDVTLAGAMAGARAEAQLKIPPACSHQHHGQMWCRDGKSPPFMPGNR